MNKIVTWIRFLWFKTIIAYIIYFVKGHVKTEYDRSKQIYLFINDNIKCIIMIQSFICCIEKLLQLTQF